MSKLLKMIFMIGAIIVIARCFYGGLANWLKGSDAEMKSVEYQVKPNDTLWHIAGENKPSDMSYDQYMYEMRKVNTKNLNTIYVGEVITILIEK